MNDIKFSIVIPVYNVEKFLHQCVDSVLCQTYKNFELLLIDDGSTDNSPNICDDYQLIDSRVRVFHKENSGQGITRNFGMKYITGDYLIFIDSDDFIEKNLLEDLTKKINDKTYNIIFYGHSRVDVNGKKMFSLIPNPPKLIYNSNIEIREELLPDFIYSTKSKKDNNFAMSVVMCCFSVSFLKKNKLKFVSEREYISEDIYFFFELFDVVENICFIKKSYYNYRQNINSTTHKYKANRYELLKFFYNELFDLSNRAEFPEECNNRIKALFLSHVIACLKLEVTHKASFISKRKKIKIICNDEFLIQNLKGFDFSEFSKGWKAFGFCIKFKLYSILYFLLYFKFVLNRGL